MSSPSLPKIVVVGSLIIDQFVRVENFPKPGETVLTDDIEVRFGGKGANQAVTASRLATQVEMIGCVGDDGFGRAYIERFEEFGIGTAGVLQVEDSPTGSAFVTLDSSSENSIVVAAGANAKLTVAQIETQAESIAAADCLLLQNEVPQEVNLAAIDVAKRSGTQIIYNPAPWRDGVEIDCDNFDLVVVNEIEVQSLLGGEISCASELPEGVIVTRGADSTLAKFGGEEFAIKPPSIEPIDTVGAGDCFCGALAAMMRLGFAERIGLANRAAGMSTLKTGAQEAMPTSHQLIR